MARGVLDAGVVLGWLRGQHRSLRRLGSLFDGARAGRTRLIISCVNLAEVLLHAAAYHRATGVDLVALLRGYRVELHAPDEAIARRVAGLPTSLADGFAAATALELGARLHTTDRELVRQLSHARLSVTVY
jgi:predicted nucleic acid-binding protein